MSVEAEVSLEWIATYSRAASRGFLRPEMLPGEYLRMHALDDLVRQGLTTYEDGYPETIPAPDGWVAERYEFTTDDLDATNWSFA